jgi:hypothetical protein
MFGYPLDWLVQDQSRLDPSFPETIPSGSPWENPTSVAIWPLVIDVLVAYVGLLLALFLGRMVLRRIRSPRRS